MRKRTAIEGLEWILEDDRFGFGQNWLKNIDHDQPECEEEWAGYYIERAIETLKERDPVKPRSVSRHGAYPQIQHFCGNCNAFLPRKQKFCSECGRGVKWE